MNARMPTSGSNERPSTAPVGIRGNRIHKSREVVPLLLCKQARQIDLCTLPNIRPRENVSQQSIDEVYDLYHDVIESLFAADGSISRESKRGKGGSEEGGRGRARRERA